MHKIRQHEPRATTPLRGNGNLAGHTLHTPEQASEHLGPEIVPASWLRERARRREIPFVKIAGKYAFTSAHLDEIIRMFEVAPEDGTRPGASPRRRPRKAAESTPGVTPLRARPPQRLRRAVGDGRD